MAPKNHHRALGGRARQLDAPHPSTLTCRPKRYKMTGVAADYAAAVAEVRAIGLDPDRIPHSKPPGARGMDRVFLDAWVLSSAASWRQDEMLRFWSLDGVQLLSSRSAVEEARRRLPFRSQRGKLTRLLRRVCLVEPGDFTLPRRIRLPEKDRSLLLAAIEGEATHLLIRGDWEHFRPYYRRVIGGVLIVPPGEYPPPPPER